MISVIMPSLNPNIKSILATITSILDNHFDIELILVLQKTSYYKLNKLKKLLKHPNIKFQSDSGLGISRARNIGIEKATGEWLLLLDDDVYLKQGMIDRISTILNKRKSLFYYGNVYTTGEEKRHYLKHAVYEKDLNFFNYNRVCSVALVIHKNLFVKYGMFDQNLGSGTYWGSGEESDFIIRTLLNHEKIKYLAPYEVYHEPGLHNMEKVVKYSRGTGALYKKHLNSFSGVLYLKFFIDLLLRLLMLFTLKKKRFLFFQGFYQGLVSYRREK